MQHKKDKVIPDIENAPEWANYLACDCDGEWFWYLGKPEFLGDFWVETIALQEAYFYEAFAGFNKTVMTPEESKNSLKKLSNL